MNIDHILDPKNRKEQVEGTLRFVLDDAHYESLLTTPRRLDAAAIKLFVSGMNMVGYHANVIRKAIRDLDQHGFIDAEAAPYELND